MNEQQIKTMKQFSNMTPEEIDFSLEGLREYYGYIPANNLMLNQEPIVDFVLGDGILYSMELDKLLILKSLQAKKKSKKYSPEIVFTPAEILGIESLLESPNLTTVIAPKLKEIRRSALQGCEKLTNIELPPTCQLLGDSSFYECTSLPQIVIPYGVTVIPKMCFKGCVNLQSVFIPDTVVEIQTLAFTGCKSLTNINIPKSVKVIGDKAFARTPLDGKIK